MSPILCTATCENPFVSFLISCNPTPSMNFSFQRRQQASLSEGTCRKNGGGGRQPPYISNQPCAPQHKLKAAPPSLAKCDCNYKQQNNDVSGGQIRSKTWKLYVSVCRELHFFCYVTFPMGKWIKISLKWGNFSNVRKRFKFDQPFWFWGYKKAHTLACPNICVRCKNCKPPGIL